MEDENLKREERKAFLEEGETRIWRLRSWKKTLLHLIFELHNLKWSGFLKVSPLNSTQLKRYQGVLILYALKYQEMMGWNKTEAMSNSNRMWKWNGFLFWVSFGREGGRKPQSAIITLARPRKRKSKMKLCSNLWEWTSGSRDDLPWQNLFQRSWKLSGLLSDLVNLNFFIFGSCSLTH